jgi:hypothetical protein
MARNGPRPADGAPGRHPAGRFTHPDLPPRGTSPGKIPDNPAAA